MPESLMTDRYMEVWNKVDLVEDTETLMTKLDHDEEQNDYPIILMSATEGYNRKVFLEEVSAMCSRILGKQEVILAYPAWEHEKRVKWLLEFAKISDPTNFTVDEQGQEIQMKVLFDEVVFQKWLKEFEPERFAELRVKRKHFQPEDW